MNNVESHITSHAVSGLGEKLIRGVGAGFVGQLLSVLSRIILPPMFLKSWGVDVYGEWLLITAAVANLALSEVGGNVYITNRLTQFYAKGEIKAFRSTLQTALVVFLTWPAVMFLIFLLLVTIVPLGSILGLRFINEELLRIVAVVLAFQILVEIPKGLILGVFRATDNLPRGVMLANYVLLIQLVFVGSGLWLGGDIIAIAVLQIIPIIFIIIFTIFEINKKFPDSHLFSFEFFNLDIAKQFFLPSVHFFLIQISQVLSTQGPVMVIGLLLGSGQVVLFVTMRMLSNIIKSVLNLLSHAAWPDMTKFEAEHNDLKLTTLFKALLRTVIALMIVVVTVLTCLGRAIYDAWLGETELYDQTVMNLFLLLLVLQVFSAVYGNLLMATNKHRGLAAVMLASSIVSIFFAYVGANIDGIKGLLYGMIAAESLMQLWAVPFLVYKHFRQFSLAMFITEAVPLIIVIPMVFEPVYALLFVPLLIMWWWRAVKPLRQCEPVAMKGS